MVPNSNFHGYNDDVDGPIDFVKSLAVVLPSVPMKRIPN